MNKIKRFFKDNGETIICGVWSISMTCLCIGMANKIGRLEHELLHSQLSELDLNNEVLWLTKELYEV